MKTRIIITVITAILLSLILVLAGCGSKESTDDTAMAAPGEISESIVFYTTDEECFLIETRFGTLEYPEKWKDKTKIDISDTEPYTVGFSAVTSAGNVHLFDICFNSGDGFLLGTLQSDGQNVPVYLNSFAFDKGSLSETEYNDCCAMEEDVNVIISRLIEKNGLKLSIEDNPAEPVPEDTSVFATATAFGSLYYPEKWMDSVKIEITKEPVYTVSFSTETSAGHTPLFDMTFNGGDGYCLGSMDQDGKTVWIYLNDFPINKDVLSEEEYFNCCAMCEDVNVILQRLAADYGFEFQ